MKKYFVYILKCSDISYYTGVTNDLDRRFAEHQEGIGKESYTHGRRPVSLVFYTDFNDINQAIIFEKQVKGWNRKKKEALINDEWEKLPGLAGCKNETSHKNIYKTGFDSAQPDFKIKNEIDRVVTLSEVEEDNRRNKINLKQALSPPGFDSAQPDI